MPVLRRPLRIWRIGDRTFEIYSFFGAAMYGARWNSPGTPVIYAAKSLEGAMLELRVHTAGLPPPSKHGYIWIDLPAGVSYERCAPSQVRGWRKDQSVTRAFGDAWVKEARS